MTLHFTFAAPIALVLLLAMPPSLAQAQLASGAPERSTNVPLADGASQRVLMLSPAKPKAAIVMLPGGAGNLGLSRDGDIAHDNNFVVRTRQQWAARGYAVMIPDTIDKANLRGQRSSADYGDIVLQLTAFAQAQFGVPVFLLGTSQGAIAAMNGAARAEQGRLAGVILTESVSVMGGSGETVFDAGPQKVRVPALIVANQDDGCRVAPPGMAPKIAAAISNSPDVRVVTVSGGDTKSRQDCGSLTPHGYYGIEDKVVGVIADWIDNHLH